MSKLITLENLGEFLAKGDAHWLVRGDFDGTTGVGYADVANNWTPYDSSSGDDQSEPFLFQATGTANGTQPDFTTGSFCQLKEKRGNSLVWIQFCDTIVSPNWYINYGTMSTEDGVRVYTNTTANSNCGPEKTIPLYNNHTYFIMATLKTDAENGCAGHFAIGNQSGSRNPFLITSDYKTFYGIYTVTGSLTTPLRLFLNLESKGTGNKVYFKLFSCVDLSVVFPTNTPTLVSDGRVKWVIAYAQKHPERNMGAIINSDGRYLKNIGMNQWDEQISPNYIYDPTGSKVSTTGADCSANLIPVLPNTSYMAYRGTGTTYSTSNIYLRWFDYAGNVINTESQGQLASFGTAFTSPNNARYLGLNTAPSKHFGASPNISINIYYANEARCLTYEPYEVVANVDTGDEVLRSTNSAHDVKTPDGTITRNASVVDLGTLNWSLSGNNFISDAITGIKTPPTTYVAADVVCGMYRTVPISQTFENLDLAVNEQGKLYIRNTAYSSAANFKAAMSGVYLVYPLATPTTEQGTPFPENVDIDDFGTMQWLKDGGNDAIVPAEVLQANLIFYPVDYKGYVDTLYKYTDGTPSNLVLKSEITDEALAERGYYKMQDLSSGITNYVNLTYTIRKVYKIGNIVTMSLVAKNETGSDIAQYAALFKMPSNTYLTTYAQNLDGFIDTNQARFKINENGDVECSSGAIPSNATIQVYVSYAVA